MHAEQTTFDYVVRIDDDGDTEYIVYIIRQWENDSPLERFRPVVYRDEDEYPLNPDGKEITWYLTLATACAQAMPVIIADYEARHEPSI